MITLTLSDIRTLIREAIEGYQEGTLKPSIQVLRDALRDSGVSVPNVKSSVWIDTLAQILRKEKDRDILKLAIEAWNDSTIGWEVCNTKHFFGKNDEIWCTIISNLLRYQKKRDESALGTYTDVLNANRFVDDEFEDELTYNDQFYREAAANEEEDIENVIEGLAEYGNGMLSTFQVESLINRCSRHVDYRNELGENIPPVLACIEVLIPLRNFPSIMLSLSSTLKRIISDEEVSAAVKTFITADTFLRERDDDA